MCMDYLLQGSVISVSPVLNEAYGTRLDGPSLNARYRLPEMETAAEQSSLVGCPSNVRLLDLQMIRGSARCPAHASCHEPSRPQNYWRLLNWRVL